jgi:hypothetical protein
MTTVISIEIKSDEERLEEVVEFLRDMSYVVDPGTMCCGSCAWNRIIGKHGDNVSTAFWSEQAIEHLFDRDGVMERTLYVSWQGDPSAICNVFRNVGQFDVIEPENETEVIAVWSAVRRFLFEAGAVKY